MTGKPETRAKNKYNAKNYDRISLFVKIGKKETIKKAANSAGQSVNTWINHAIDSALDDQQTTE